VFFNLFAAAEPYTSTKVTHGTPWNPMHWSVSLATYARMKLYMGCLRIHFLSRAERAESSRRRQSRQRWPI